LHAIGIDISSFNAFISNCRIAEYDIKKLDEILEQITIKLYSKVKASKAVDFENKLINHLKIFNNKYFPVPEFKYKLRQNLIDEDKYGIEKEKLFLPIYNKLISEYKIELLKKNSKTFLEKWYFKNIRNETDSVFNEIKQIKDTNIKKILALILSQFCSLNSLASCRRGCFFCLDFLKNQNKVVSNPATHGASAEEVAAMFIQIYQAYLKADLRLPFSHITP
jgi:hypothetical protein